MYFLRRLAIRSLIKRLMRGGRGNYDRGRGGRGQSRYASRGSSGGRFGFFGPLPYYSKQTRGGSRVSVGGCCLPLALGMAAVPGAAASVAVRRHRR